MYGLRSSPTQLCPYKRGVWTYGGRSAVSWMIELFFSHTVYALKSQPYITTKAKARLLVSLSVCLLNVIIQAHNYSLLNEQDRTDLFVTLIACRKITATASKGFVSVAEHTRTDPDYYRSRSDKTTQPRSKSPKIPLFCLWASLSYFLSSSFQHGDNQCIHYNVIVHDDTHCNVSSVPFYCHSALPPQLKGSIPSTI